MSSLLSTFNRFAKQSQSLAVGAGINSDAWGRQKVIRDKRLLHGLFTDSIPTNKWYEMLNGTELTSFTKASSLNGKMRLTSGATPTDVSMLRTFNNPRYQPNRGLIYSSSIFCPNPTNDGVRDWGCFTDYAGVFFRLKSDGLYVCIQSSTGTTPNALIENKIPTENLPPEFDVSKGNIYDIQGQWRGVGDWHFFIGDPQTGVSTKVYTYKHLNLYTELSVFNPAMPIAFRCKNITEEVILECGCVDVSSEGGEIEDGQYSSITVNNESGQLALTGFNAPVMVIKSQKLFNTITNTRDATFLGLSAYSDQRAFVRIWRTRDETAITLNGQTWANLNDGHTQYIVAGLDEDGSAAAGTFTFDTTKAVVVFGNRVAQDVPYEYNTDFEKSTRIQQSPGDLYIVTLHRETGGAHNGGVTWELSEEI